MSASGDSSGPIPQFSAVSVQTNEPIDLPYNIVWKGIQLDDDELILYINEEGEQQMITARPFDEEKYYKIILFDYS